MEPDVLSVEPDVLKEAVARLRAAGDPRRIVLFGSHARGDAGPASDVDLLVIEESDLPRHRRAARYYRALDGLFPSTDVVVWTEDEINAWRNVRSHFITTALREGVVLYE